MLQVKSSAKSVRYFPTMSDDIKTQPEPVKKPWYKQGSIYVAAALAITALGKWLAEEDPQGALDVVFRYIETFADNGGVIGLAAAGIWRLRAAISRGG